MTVQPDNAWLCRNCHKTPVPALGEKLCPDCAAEAVIQPDEPTDHDRAIEHAKDLLEKSERATTFESRDIALAVARALQGILVCQIESVSVTRPDMPPDIGFVLPEGFNLPEPESEIGPKPWGQ